MQGWTYETHIYVSEVACTDVFSIYLTQSIPTLLICSYMYMQDLQDSQEKMSFFFVQKQ